MASEVTRNTQPCQVVSLWKSVFAGAKRRKFRAALAEKAKPSSRRSRKILAEEEKARRSGGRKGKRQRAKTARLLSKVKSNPLPENRQSKSKANPTPGLSSAPDAYAFRGRAACKLKTKPFSDSVSLSGHNSNFQFFDEKRITHPHFVPGVFR